MLVRAESYNNFLFGLPSFNNLKSNVILQESLEHFVLLQVNFIVTKQLSLIFHLPIFYCFPCKELNCLSKSIMTSTTQSC